MGTTIVSVSITKTTREDEEEVKLIGRARRLPGSYAGIRSVTNPSCATARHIQSSHRSIFL